MSNENNENQVSRVAIKPPPFYRHNPAVWFRQLESQFELAQITNEQTRYHHVMATLPEDVAINLNPTLNTYSGLKDLILQIYQKSKSELLEDALGSVSLDGQKPSLCVLRLQRKLQECGLEPDEALIKHKVLQAMPSDTRTTLAGQTQNANLTTFSSVADAVYVMSQQQQPSINAVAKSQPVSQQISSRGSLHPFTSKQLPVICRFHVYFGAQAKKCTPWCKWPGNRPSHQEASSRSTSRSNSPVRHQSEN